VRAPVAIGAMGADVGHVATSSFQASAGTAAAAPASGSAR
jgi:hypothetical protein